MSKLTDLMDSAMQISGQYKLHGYKSNSAGGVASALITHNNSIYTGINANIACNLGLCAEQSAMMEMLKHRETEIAMIVAMQEEGQILPPCGKCRELILQINKANLKTDIVLAHNKIVKLEDLLPSNWLDLVK